MITLRPKYGMKMKIGREKLHRRAVRVDGRGFIACGSWETLEVKFNARTKNRTASDDYAAPEIRNENEDWA